jgi:hypothetical protein
VPVFADAQSLIEQRAQAIDDARRLREFAPGDHSGRREAYRRIRALNESLVAAHPEVLRETECRLRRAVRRSAQDRIADSREYFFALHDRIHLEKWATAALSQAADFRV